VIVAFLIVGDDAALHGVRNQSRVDARQTVRARERGARREFECRKRDPRVAVRDPHERFESVVVEHDTRRAQTPFRIGERAANERGDVFVRERVQYEDPRAREQRRIHFERWVLRRRADQRDRAVLDVGQDRILLRLVEAMDLIDEEHGSLAERARAFGFGDDGSQVRHTRADGGKADERRTRRAGDHFGERRLSRAGRSPQNHRRYVVGLDRAPQRMAFTDDVALADVFGERARTHPRCERLRRLVFE
jgi:hypothetical protein